MQLLTGIPAGILDAAGRDIRICQNRPPFCQAVNDCPEGHSLCAACGREIIKSCGAGGGFQVRRCHLGICQAVMPLFDAKHPLAYLFFGGCLDDSPIEVQWENTRRLLDWYPCGAETLRESFFQFRQYTPEAIRACAEILEALSFHIQLKGMILAAEQSDEKRLELYLNEHYREKLSLRSLSEALHIGRTKLCALAKELSGGRTLSYLISRRRILEAQRLLIQSGLPISAVAEAVGISDYNYFSKVFRSFTGDTPSHYRKLHRAGPEQAEP